MVVWFPVYPVATVTARIMSPPPPARGYQSSYGWSNCPRVPFPLNAEGFTGNVEKIKSLQVGLSGTSVIQQQNQENS